VNEGEQEMSALGTASTSTLERLVPAALHPDDATGQETYQLHIERYDFASRFISSGRVLDCACGVGYGSHRLLDAGDRMQRVVGVDIDESAIAYARANFSDPRLDYVRADATTFDAEPFDAIVSFETIEHVPDPESVIDNFVRLLAPGGLLIASVPVTPSVDVNPFHLHDFTPSSFRRMFVRRGLQEVQSLLQRQPYQPLKMLAGKETRLSDMRKNLLGYYATHPGAAMKRLCSTALDGFCNKYLTCVWQR
jgi:2-polyprenyl-3-methyl-5-hydroxy-6-metoxy-1,4-benzoquinol methylase